jgi:TolA-binding protein
MSSPQERLFGPLDSRLNVGSRAALLIPNPRDRVELEALEARAKAAGGPARLGVSGLFGRSLRRALKGLPLTVLVAVGGVGLGLWSATAAAQAPAQAPAAKEEDMGAVFGAMYKKAMESFAKGEFKECIEGLKEMIAKGAEGPGLESVRFTIGSALFNQKDYKGAKEAFELYLKEYPAGTKVLEASTAVGQCMMNLGDKAGALKSFAELAQKPGANKERMVLVQANLLTELKKKEEAIALLRPTVNALLPTDESVQIAALLAELEVEAGNVENSFKLLDLLYGRFDVVENPLQVNALAFKIGDALRLKKEFKLAVRAYNLVQRKEDVLLLQREKLLRLKARYDANIASLSKNPERLAEVQKINSDIKALFDDGTRVLGEVEQAEDYAIPLRTRQAAVYLELKRHWNVIVLFEALLKSGNPKPEERENMEFTILMSHAELKNSKELDQSIDRYLKEFPAGKYLPQVNYFKGTQLMSANDLEGAETLFGTAIKNKTAGENHESILFLLGNIRYELQLWDKALETYDEYRKQYPKGESFEEALYRKSLCYFFKGDFEKALPSLSDYVKEHPDGQFAPDAGFRIAACYMAAERPKEVIQRCLEWEKSFGFHKLMPEVLSLLGDAYVAIDKRAEAADAYFRALQLNASDEVLNYVLFEANKQYQKLGQWDKSVELFKNFIERNPKHPAVVASMYWLARALVKEGKPEEGKAFLSEKIYSFINDRASDAVEQLLTQLAQMCSKKPRPVPVAKPVEGAKVEGGTSVASAAAPAPAPAPAEGAAAAASTPEGTPAPAPPPFDPDAELAKYLSAKKAGGTPLVNARVLFARSELARMTRRPKEADELVDRIGAEFAPRDLGAALLARTGDRLLELKNIAKAEAIYRELMAAFPKSELLDYAYNGLGQMALQKGDAEGALKWFNEAIEKVGADVKLRDVTLGKGRALLQLGKLDDAKAIFEQVAATKEWRGPVTADAMYLLGEVAFQKKDFQLGLQFFQKVVLAYQRYPQPVAKSYLRAADCYEKLGDAENAKAQLREMVSKEKLAGLAELEQAKTRLEGAQ